MLKNVALFALLFISIVARVEAGTLPDCDKHEVYTDSNGDIILRIPPTFVLIAGEINIPLLITPKNGVFKLVESSNSWALIPMTQSEFDSLSPTPASHLALECHDIDGDGVADIFIRDSSSYRDSFIITNLQGTANVDAYSDARNGIDLSQGAQLTIVDVNGDGINDIVSGDTTYLGSRSGKLIDTSPAPEFTHPGNVIGLSAGEFKVTEAGAATYNIPLSLPPGTSGVVPQVGLAYSSQSGDGILGVGWSISGLPAISRCPKNLAIDGVLDGINFDSGDSYCLNGQRLMLNANSTDEYHTEIDNFSVIKAYSGRSGPEYFTVTTQANEVHYYGKAPVISPATDAYIERGGFPAGSEASAWVLKAIVDHKGNYIRYDYEKDTAAGSHLLTNIAYGGNLTHAQPAYNNVEFRYIDAASPWQGFAHGGVVSRNKQLDQIMVKQDADIFRNYQLIWSRTIIPEERDYVIGIQECFDTNANNCLPATTFEFEQPSRKPSAATLYEPFETTTTDIIPSNSNRMFAQVADFNGNGYADMLVPNGSGWAIYTSEWQIQSGGVDTGSDVKWKNGYLSQHPLERTIKRSVVSDKYETVADSKVGEKGYAQVIDFNGDGKNDLLIPFASGDWHVITLDPGTREILECEPDGRGGQFCVNTDVSYDFTYKSLNISSSAYKDTIVADVNGDGLHDIVFKQGKDLFYYQNLGGSFSAAKSINVVYGDFYYELNKPENGVSVSTSSLDFINASMMDVNGNGLSDIIMKHEYRWTQSCLDPKMLGTRSTCVPTTSSSSQNGVYIASMIDGVITYTYSNTVDAASDLLRTGDFNGDGLTDIAVRSSWGWRYYLSKGDGTFTDWQALSVLEAADADIANRHIFIDINGNGRTDILEATSSNMYNIYLSVPSTTKGGVDFVNRGSMSIGSDSKATVRLADINGDGKVDLLSASSDSGHWKLQQAARSYIKDHVVTKITNGFGVETDIAYATLNSGIPLINIDSSQKPDSTDYITPFAGIFVVTEAATQSSSSESALLQYRYGGFLAHKKGRGYLGFETVQTTDPQSGVVTTTKYNQLFPLTGMPIGTTREYQGVLLSTADNTYTQATSANGGRRVYLKTSREESYNLDLSSNGVTPTAHQKVSETLTTNGYDNWNNLLSSTVDIKDAAGSLVHRTTTSNQFSDGAYNTLTPAALSLSLSHSQVASQTGANPDAQQFGRLSQTSVTKTRYKNTASGSAESQSRLSKFSYYGNGMLRESLVNGFTTALFYDRFGNRVAEQAYAKVDASNYQKRGQYWFYDSRGQYLASQMNQSGETESYLYNGSAGSAATKGLIYSKTTTGPNKLASTSHFDVQGQVIRQILADGNQTEVSRTLCSGCGSNFITETTDSSNKPQTQTYLDRFAREREKRVRGFNGNWIVAATTYDKLGQATHQSVPNYGSASAVTTQQDFDALGRVYQQSQPTESSSVWVTSKINGLVTTSTDENGLVYKDTHSADGKLLTRTDPKLQTINYYYDAYGNSGKVTTRAKNQTDSWQSQSISINYDNYGRKLATDDPDKGRWSYDYNDFGELIKQTDAKGQATTMGFDVMGRMTWRKDNTNLACWGYGSSANKHNVGKPTWVKQWARQSSCNTSAAVQSSENYSYDSFGRPEQTDFVIDGNSYNTRSEYNDKGQLSRQYYPSNNGAFYVDFHYNADHFLYLQTDSSNRNLRRITAMDALGNITSQTFGNGTSEARGFSSRTGRISTVELKKGSRQIHQLSYGDFDGKGNVMFRAHNYYNGAGVLSLAFSEDFTYDTLNRLETRSLSVGSGSLTDYSYDEQYQYDGFGNIKSRKGYSGGSYSVNLASYQYLQTTSVNRLNSASVDGNRYSQFTYDNNGNTTADGNRTFTYNAFDKASRIQSGAQYTDYRYNHNRAVLSRNDYRQDEGEWKTFSTDYVGKLYQQERRYKGDTLENTRHKYMVGNIMVVRNQNSTLGNSEEVQYQHSDHQGSIISITNQAGDVLEQYFYTAFGKPMKLAGDSIVQSVIPMERGYTGHEMLPGLDIIQMGGRIYDPTLARFLQADPNIQAPANLQNYNRYSYVLNNPLTYTDPSGYFFKKIFGFIKDNWRVIAAAVVTYFTAGVASGWAASWGFTGAVSNAIVAGAIVGAAGGYVATGSLRGAMMGALSGAVFGAIGGQINADALSGGTWSTGEQMFAHAMAGGVMSELQGGKFGNGFITAGIMKGVGKIQTGVEFGRTMIQSLVGGTLSKLTGGKFANGAITSVIQYVVNEVSNALGLSKPKAGARYKDTEWRKTGRYRTKKLFEVNNEHKLTNLLLGMGKNHIVGQIADSNMKFASIVLDKIPTIDLFENTSFSGYQREYQLFEVEFTQLESGRHYWSQVPTESIMWISDEVLPIITHTETKYCIGGYTCPTYSN
ncbi:toxin TcdB middle/N-terminal domain-containing protein [Shewanella sp. YLB-07]|uniref:toxin TcdB middle/N-terminal domain-containing protein n=1 Tax=Shewanella sp. YLB-07 TaxID=2601268 RepID=UPI00128E5192|nr:toxin TcdB middle/N-terminal domain-containing protein [Shewanella sp. YLB-07]MPY24443.1 hypothetical protein [Shewanella sp. YLB-07]